MRAIPILAVTLAFAATAAGCHREVSSSNHRTNVLLVSIDSLRADHVGAFGYARATTPVFDRLAAQGALYTSAISSTSWTLPAHAALLTGLPDSAHGVTKPTSRLGESATTLAESLRAAGYQTAGFYSGPFLHPVFGLAQGFERYLDCTSYGLGTMETEVRGLHARSHKDRTNPFVLWSVLRELEALDGRPFFFFVHMWDVHYDLIPPEPFASMFGTSSAETYQGADFRRNQAFRPGVEPDLYERVIGLYDGEIRYTDETLGLILGAFAARGLLEDTLVVVTADHGDEFLDHGGKGHRHTLYQELIRVPLVFWRPGEIKHARVDEPVSLIDIAPTILELAGLPAHPEAMGRSLASSLRDGKPPSRTSVVAELHAGSRAGHRAALIDGTDKIILGNRGQLTYFDLQQDPQEMSPRPAGRDPRVRELAERLERYRAKARQRGARIGSAEDAHPSPGLRSELRSLGYLD